MLCAYYDKTCDSHALLADYAIAGEKSYGNYINQYDVIYWDMTGIKPYTGNYKNLVPFLIRSLTDEIAAQYPKVIVKEDLSATLVNTVENAGNKIVIIIDEWDAPIRENPGIQAEYLEFLRSLVKNSGTTSKIFAAAYMTGILPIKKDGSQSAISDFEEYSMLEPGTFAEYVGFTEAEVLKLCEERRQSFEKMKVWYDGYSVGDQHSIVHDVSIWL